MAARRRNRFFWVIAILLVAGAGWYFWHAAARKKEAEQAAAQTPPPPSVTVQEIAPRDIALQYEYSGRTAGAREVEIRARVSGILQKRAYLEGERVKKGQLLFVIDPAPFQATQSAAQATAIQAESNWKRVQELYKEQAVSGVEYDQARAAYAQTRAVTRTAEINLGYTTVTAPIGGVTSQEGLSEGSLVTENTSLLTRLTQIDPIYVEFAYPDSESMTQRQGVANGTIRLPADGMLRAEIRFGDGTSYGQEGEISFTDSIIDPQTGSVRARAVLPNKDGVLMPGQFVRVLVKGFTLRQAISIPDQAVLQGPQGTFVYLVDAEGKAVAQPVKLGALNAKERIISEGLKAGDRLVTDGMIKVQPNAAVKIVSPADATAGAKATEPKPGSEATKSGDGDANKSTPPGAPDSGSAATQDHAATGIPTMGGQGSGQGGGQGGEHGGDAEKTPDRGENTSGGDADKKD